MFRKEKLNLIKQIYSRFNVDLSHKKYQMFETTCSNNYQELALWIYNEFGIDNEHILNAFRIGCYNGYLTISQWLYEIGDINIQEVNQIFNYACGSYYENQTIDILEWLISKNATVNNEAFVNACMSGKLDRVTFLYQLGGNNLDLHAAFMKCFLDISDIKNVYEWLYEQTNIDIFANNHELFIYACRDNEINKAQWLIERSNDRYAIKITEHKYHNYISEYTIDGENN